MKAPAYVVAVDVVSKKAYIRNIPAGTTKGFATHFARNRKKLSTPTGFLMPVIVLLFSMHKDEAYFSWLVEPCEDTNQLRNLTALGFWVFDLKQLDRMVRRITNWYKRMATTIVAHAGAVDASECRDDG